MGVHNFKRQNKNTLVKQACERIDQLEKKVRELKLKNEELTEQLNLSAVSKSFCECKNEPSCRIQDNRYYCNDCNKELE